MLRKGSRRRAARRSVRSRSRSPRVGHQQLTRAVPRGLPLTTLPFTHAQHVAAAVQKGAALLQLPRHVEIVDVHVGGLGGDGRFRVLLLRPVAGVVEVEDVDALRDIDGIPKCWRRVRR